MKADFKWSLDMGDTKVASTPQEHWLFGGSTEYTLIKRPEDWYVPISLLNGSASLEEIVELRKAFGCLRSQRVGELMEGDLLGKWVALSFEEIDPETNQTVHDPRILGIWNPREKKIEPTNHDLTEEFYARLRELDRDGEGQFHLRGTEHGSSKTIEQG